MNNASRALRNETSQNIGIGVTVDGTWQRRGYTSLNGVVIAMSVDSEKLLDVETMSRYYKLYSITDFSIMVDIDLKIADVISKIPGEKKMSLFDV